MANSENTGGGNSQVTDQELLAVFRESRDPVLSTSEVADRIPIQRRSTLTRLRALEERGELDSKQIGGRNTVWWVADRSPTGGAVDSLADRFGGFGALEGQTGDEFERVVRSGRDELNSRMEDREDALSGK